MIGWRFCWNAYLLLELDFLACFRFVAVFFLTGAAFLGTLFLGAFFFAGGLLSPEAFLLFAAFFFFILDFFGFFASGVLGALGAVFS